jgi:hypothetical protein
VQASDPTYTIALGLSAAIRGSSPELCSDAKEELGS